MNNRTHKKNIESQRERTRSTPDQIRRSKCEKSKLRNITRKLERQKINDERLEHWRSLSIESQLQELDKRPGNCLKQRKRLYEATITKGKQTHKSQGQKQRKATYRKTRRK